MGLAELDRIDIVAASPDGSERWIIVAGAGWPLRDEAKLVVQLLLKLAGHQRHAAHQAQPVVLEVVSADEPPACVVELLARLQIETWVGLGKEKRLPRGRPSVYALDDDGYPELE